MEQIILGTKDLANFFDVSQEAVRQWHRAGCPKRARGQWDLKAVFKWYTDTILAERDTSETLQAVKQKYWKAKAEREELKVAQEKGLLISKDEVHKGWAARVAEYKNGCFNLENSLPILLEGKSQAEMRKVIYGFVWDMFDRVCRTGRFCKKPTKKEMEKAEAMRVSA